MKRYIQTTFICLVLALFAANLSAQTLEDQVAGIWNTEDGDSSKIEMYKSQNGTWVGKIISTDVTRSIGKFLFVEGVYNSEENVIEGTIVIPDKEWRISTTISMENPGVLTVLGQKFLLSKTFYWKKAA
jgi:hypothetical protein